MTCAAHLTFAPHGSTTIPITTQATLAGNLTDLEKRIEDNLKNTPSEKKEAFFRANFAEMLQRRHYGEALVFFDYVYLREKDKQLSHNLLLQLAPQVGQDLIPLLRPLLTKYRYAALRTQLLGIVSLLPDASRVSEFLDQITPELLPELEGYADEEESPYLNQIVNLQSAKCPAEFRGERLLKLLPYCLQDATVYNLSLNLALLPETGAKILTLFEEPANQKLTGQNKVLLHNLLTALEKSFLLNPQKQQLLPPFLRALQGQPPAVNQQLTIEYREHAIRLLLAGYQRELQEKNPDENFLRAIKEPLATTLNQQLAHFESLPVEHKSNLFEKLKIVRNPQTMAMLEVFVKRELGDFSARGLEYYYYQDLTQASSLFLVEDTPQSYESFKTVFNIIKENGYFFDYTLNQLTHRQDEISPQRAAFNHWLLTEIEANPRLKAVYEEKMKNVTYTKQRLLS